MGTKTNTDSGDSLGTRERDVFERMRARLRELEGDLAGRILHYEAQGIQLAANQPTLVCQTGSSAYVLTRLPTNPERRLSPRETAVAELVRQGLMNPAIANALGVKRNTVNSFMRRIMNKLHVTNRIGVALYMLSVGTRNN